MQQPKDRNGTVPSHRKLPADALRKDNTDRALQDSAVPNKRADNPQDSTEDLRPDCPRSTGQPRNKAFDLPRRERSVRRTPGSFESNVSASVSARSFARWSSNCRSSGVAVPTKNAYSAAFSGRAAHVSVAHGARTRRSATPFRSALVASSNVSASFVNATLDDVARLF